MDINNTRADGDPVIRYQLSGATVFTMGVDDSDYDKFKIGTTSLDTDTRMIVDSNGNVGIGTTFCDAAKLEVWSENNSAGAFIINNASNAEDAVYAYTNGTGNAFFSNHSGSAGNIAVFQGGGTDRMVIDREGDVGIGVSAPGNILTIEQNSTTDPIADAWSVYSSRRWKTNIEQIHGALEKVRRLRGVSYEWKADGKDDIGLIAEEVGEVIPQVVSFEENGKDARSVDYARLVAVLIEAVKEQQEEIEALKKIVESLR